LLLLDNARLAEHDQHSRQCLRIASVNPLLPTAKMQKAIHNVTVQCFDGNVFALQPPAEICYGDDLPPDRVPRVALFAYCGRIRVEVFAQRPLAKPFNGA
jgi:hypothetical protein